MESCAHSPVSQKYSFGVLVSRFSSLLAYGRSKYTMPNPSSSLIHSLAVGCEISAASASVL